MDQTGLTMLLVGIAVSAGLFAIGVVLYPKLKSERQGYPFEAAVEAVLLPIIFEGVCAAYRLSERGVDELHQRIEGVNKKQIADSVYSMLPEKVGNFDLSLIKRIVPKERFEALVQDAFDRFDRFFVQHQTHFDDLFEKWKVASAPAQ